MKKKLLTARPEKLKGLIPMEEWMGPWIESDNNMTDQQRKEVKDEFIREIRERHNKQNMGDKTNG